MHDERTIRPTERSCEPWPTRTDVDLSDEAIRELATRCPGWLAAATSNTGALIQLLERGL